MMRWFTVLIGTWIAVAPVLAASPATSEWMLKADYVDACSCDMTCPCLFGGSPTHGYCKGATLVESFFEAPVRAVRILPISVEWTKDKVKITTEGTLIELEQIRNADGEPIKVLGLPAQGFPYLNHTQYKTV